MAIRLYDLCAAESERRFSPYCWRAKLALRHKGLEVDTIPWKFTEKEVIARFGAKTVPVIVDGERAVADSWAIAEYLDEAYPERPALIGGARGELRFLKAFAEAVMTAGLAPLIIHDVYERCDKADKPYFRESREKRFGKALEAVQADRDERVLAYRRSLAPLRQTLSDQPYVAGDSPGFADHISVAPLFWARSISPFRVLEDDDPVAAWRERMLDAYGGYARQAPGYD